MKKIKTMIVTTSRADYGLLQPLIRAMASDESFEMKLAVTGSHLSTLHGRTVDQIEEDGLRADCLINMTPVGDLEQDVCAAIAEGLQGFSGIFAENPPDLLIVLGDRYELLSVCTAALIHKIPIAHIHGGESTFGAIDENIRHAVTKMSALHFPSIPAYGDRIIQMGENPERVFVVGALGIDGITGVDLMDVEELSRFSGVDFSGEVALMTYHPVTLDDGKSAPMQIGEVMEALFETDLSVLVTAPNMDAGGLAILEVIERAAAAYPSRITLVKNLGQRAYLSAMRHARLMIGNTSSGILESASFRIPVVNIGDRQGGRIRPGNVIDCACRRSDIRMALDRALSKDFEESIASLVNPYGDGKTAGRILAAIKTVDFGDKASLLKKRFYDMESAGAPRPVDASPIVLMGAGGHAKVIIEIIRKYHPAFHIVGITDKDEAKIGQSVLGVPVIGTDDILVELAGKGVRKALITLGMVESFQPRLKLYRKARESGFELVSVVHGASVVSDSAEFGDGNALMAGSIINAGVRVGSNCILNTGCIIEHDCILGNNIHVAPGATLSGGVTIGDNCLIGAGAVVIQGIRIGENCIIGAGSAVVRDIPPNSVVAGVPARHIRFSKWFDDTNM